jgi:hypothetical protein
MARVIPANHSPAVVIRAPRSMSLAIHDILHITHVSQEWDHQFHVLVYNIIAVYKVVALSTLLEVTVAALPHWLGSSSCTLLQALLIGPPDITGYEANRTDLRTIQKA